MNALCKNCGQTLPEDADICPSCGTPVPSPEPQDVLAAAFAQIDQQLAPATPDPPPEPPHPDDPQPEEAPLPRKKGVKKGLLLLAAVLVLMAVLVTVLTRVSPKGGGLSGIVYLNEDSRLMYRRDAKSETTPIPLSELSASDTALTGDGNYLYYMQGEKLYRADLTRAVESGYTPERIASNVHKFDLMQDSGAVYYTTGIGENSRLYYYDGWESRLLAGACGYDYSVRETEKYIYYTGPDGDASACFRVPLGEEGEPEKMIDELSFIVALSDDVIVYYLRDGLYAQSPGSERVCITDCMVYLVDRGVEDGKVSVTFCAENPTPDVTHDQTCLDLCRYEDGVTTVLAADIHALEAYSAGICIYGRLNPAGTMEYYQKIKDQEFPFVLDKDSAIFNMGIAVLNNSEAVLKMLNVENWQVELDSYTIGETGLTDPAVISSSFFGSLYQGTYDGEDALYYFENPDSDVNSGDLILYCGGEKTTIAENAHSAIILPDSDTVFITSDPWVANDLYMKLTLSAVKDGETTFIADAVRFWDIAVLGENRVLYLADDTLYLWNGKTSEKLEENVREFWVPDGALASSETYFCEYYHLD